MGLELKASTAEDQAATQSMAQRGFMTTTLDGLVHWARTGSLLPTTFGLVCCARRATTWIASALLFGPVRANPM
jgi:NADH:ubiquinone oxidoreductase subunit B-like Fe-S oxidoreductase